MTIFDFWFLYSCQWCLWAKDNRKLSSLFLCLQAEPTQALNIPVIPVGPLLATAYPFAKHPPYVLSWLNSQISAQDMMDQNLFEKLVLNNFCKFQNFLFSFEIISQLFVTKSLSTLHYEFFIKRIPFETLHHRAQGLLLRSAILTCSLKWHK